MIRPLLFNIASDAYEEFLAIGIAFVSFVELGISIAGCFSAFGKGHYYRNIKLINLCSAFTALVLTETALMSFAYQGDSTILNCAFGIGVGVIIILIAIYILIAPKISIVERKKKNVYKLIPNEKPIDFSINEQEFVYQLTHSKFYGNYVYIGKINGNIVDGIIIKQKSPIFKWNIWIKILVIILSEILIFPYAVGALVFHFKSSQVLDKLDKKMIENNYIKINDKEE